MKKKSKKICMITTSNLAFDTRILNEAEVLAKDHDLTILTRKYSQNGIFKKRPFKVFQIDYLKPPIFILRILASLFSLTKAAFNQNPDIFHAHDLDGLLCAFLPALLKRKILIYDSHELWSELYPFSHIKGIRWLIKPLEKIAMTKVSQGITVNESIAKFLAKKYHREFLVLRNCMPVERKRKRSLYLREQFKDKIIILHLGSTGEGRGAEQIFKAASLLPVDFAVVFVGANKREKELRGMIEKLGLEKKIFLIPAVSPEEIVSVASEADLGLVLTQNISLSYYYSLPNKLFQYIAAEVPVLASNFPEYRKNILQNGIGEIVDPSHFYLISQKIIEMVKLKNQKRYRQNLRGLVKRKYNWEIESKKLLSFYKTFV